MLSVFASLTWKHENLINFDQKMGLQSPRHQSGVQFAIDRPISDHWLLFRLWRQSCSNKTLDSMNWRDINATKMNMRKQGKCDCPR